MIRNDIGCDRLEIKSIIPAGSITVYMEEVISYVNIICFYSLVDAIGIVIAVLKIKNNGIVIAEHTG